MIKLINESNNLSDFRGNSRAGNATRVRIKATGKTGWVESTVHDKWGQGIRVVYDDRPGMWPDFFTVDEVEILEPVKKPKTESFDDDFEQYTYVKSKDVYDADGFRTEYTMYYDEVEDRYVFVFGDSDIYNPNDGYEEFDYECDTEREADEWFDNYKGFEDLDEGLRKSTKLKEGLTCNDTKHNWFLCSDRYETVEVLSEEQCNDLVIEAVYNAYVSEGIIDEDDETYWDEDKFYKDFESDIIEAKYGVTGSAKGLKTPDKDYIIIKDSNYVGKLPCGYYVDEDGDLLNRRGAVVGEVKNKPRENNLKTYRVWYLPDDPRERETFKDIPARSKEDAQRQVSAYGYVGYVTHIEECN